MSQGWRRRGLARLCAQWIALWLLHWTVVPSAHALTLRVTPGVTCLESAQLQVALTQVASRDTLRADADVEVIGSIHDPRTVLLRVHHPDGAVFERTFSPAPDRCPHLHQAVALALALALKAIPPVAELPAQEIRTASRVQGLALGLGPLLGIGLAGGWGFGGELSGTLQLRHAALRVAGMAAQTTRVELAGGYFQSVSVAARLDACGRAGLKRDLHGELCLAGLAGSLFLRGEGLAKPLHDRLRQLGLGLDLGLEWQWRHGAELRAGAAIMAGLEPLDVVVLDAAGGTLDERRLPPVYGLLVVSSRYDFIHR